MTPEQKADSVSAQHLTKFKAALKEAHKLADLPRNLDYRAQRMVQIVDELAALVAPVSPCKKGCGFCCHQATVISEWEAKQIAQFAKRKMNEVKDYEPGHSRREELIDRFWGQPCPFLDNGACGIYPVRPFSCRLHFSLADDNSQCDITGKPNEVVPYFNFQPMEFAVANLFLQSGCRKWADIREFFSSKEPEPRYRLTKDTRTGAIGIWCAACDKVSYHQDDVKNRYCAKCSTYFE